MISTLLALWVHDNLPPHTYAMDGCYGCRSIERPHMDGGSELRQFHLGAKSAGPRRVRRRTSMRHPLRRIAAQASSRVAARRQLGRRQEGGAALDTKNNSQSAAAVSDLGNAPGRLPAEHAFRRLRRGQDGAVPQAGWVSLWSRTGHHESSTGKTQDHQHPGPARAVERPPGPGRAAATLHSLPAAAQGVMHPKCQKSVNLRAAWRCSAGPAPVVNPDRAQSV